MLDFRGGVRGVSHLHPGKIKHGTNPKSPDFEVRKNQLRKTLQNFLGFVQKKCEMAASPGKDVLVKNHHSIKSWVYYIPEN